MSARLVAVSTGGPRQVAVRRGRPFMSAISKEPVAGRVAAGPEGLDGDEQADLRVHGGPDKAVYAYAEEDTAWWEAELGRPLGPGAFGENLTVAGLDVTGAVIGERWRVGTTELEVCQPRQPCSKLGIRFGDPRMVKRFAQVARPGAYLRVLVPGQLGAGDPSRWSRGRRTTSASGSSSGRSCTTTTASPPGRQRRRSCPRRSPPGCASARPRPRRPSARPSCGAWPPWRCRA